MVNAEIREIDWNSIDSYPLFASCDETASKENQRRCFEQKLVTHFNAALDEFQFTLTAGQNPMVAVIFVIDVKGDITIEAIEKDAALAQQIPEIDAIISQSLKNVPPIAPALKRGIPVNTKFRIPIQLNVN